MIILFKNAKSGMRECGQKFFNGNDYEFTRCDITIAQVTKGVDGVIEYLKKCPTFTGKVIGGAEDTLNHKTFIKFTQEHTTTKPRFSEDTGDFIEKVEVKEDYNYLMIINQID